MPFKKNSRSNKQTIRVDYFNKNKKSEKRWIINKYIIHLKVVWKNKAIIYSRNLFIIFIHLNFNSLFKYLLTFIQVESNNKKKKNMQLCENNNLKNY